MRRWLTLAIGCLVSGTFAASWAFHLATYFGFGAGGQSWLSAGGVWHFAVVMGTALTLAVPFFGDPRASGVAAPRKMSAARAVASELALVGVWLYLLIAWVYWTKHAGGLIIGRADEAVVVGPVGERRLNPDEAGWYRAHALRADSAMWVMASSCGLAAMRQRLPARRPSAAAEVVGREGAASRTQAA